MDTASFLATVARLRAAHEGKDLLERLGRLSLEYDQNDATTTKAELPVHLRLVRSEPD
jgi:hypothetical protein